MGLKYKRILLKMSGESLGGKEGKGIDARAVESFVEEIKEIKDHGIQIAVVTGGGNFFRGLPQSRKGISRIDGDFVGMTATVMNAVVLKNFLKQADIEATVQSALFVEKITERIYPPKAVEALEEGKIVIFAGGTGNPYFTTDTAGVLRAVEIDADLMLKATRVDGIYTADPEKDKTAVKFDTITYREALEKSLEIMDGTAFALAMENRLPVIVFNFNRRGNLKKILIENQPLGTLVKP